MSDYNAAKGGTGATLHVGSDDGEGGVGYAASDNATAGQDGFVIIQTLESVQKTVLDLGLFIGGE